MDVPDFGRADYIASPATAGVVAIAEPPPVEDKLAFVRAIGYGAFAALIGSVIYALVGLWIHIGLVAILVGGMVATGMMNGSQGKGGRRYQVVAVFLTYFAVSLAGVMDLLWYESRHGTNVGADVAHHPVIVIAFFLFGPIAELLSSFGGGLLDLLILFFGMQAAWRIARGGPGFLKLRPCDSNKPLGLR